MGSTAQTPLPPRVLDGVASAHRAGGGSVGSASTLSLAFPDTKGPVGVPPGCRQGSARYSLGVDKPTLGITNDPTQAAIVTEPRVTTALCSGEAGTHRAHLTVCSCVATDPTDACAQHPGQRGGGPGCVRSLGSSGGSLADLQDLLAQALRDVHPRVF